MIPKVSKLALLVALSGFVAAVLLDPSDLILHLKLPLLILTLTIWLVRVFCGMVNPGSPIILATVLLFALVLPGIASVISLLGDSLPVGDPQFQIIKGFLITLLIPVILSERIDLIKHILRWSVIIAGFILIVAILGLISPVAFLAIYEFALDKQNVFISTTDHLGLGIGSVYYKTVSLLVFPVAYNLRNLLYGSRKVISSMLLAVFVAAALCSGSRGITIGVFLVVAVFMFQKIKNLVGLRVAMLVLLAVVALPMSYFASFFHSGESSNAAKIGHMYSYATEFSERPSYLLWGQGLDTEFYTQGFHAKTTLTELTYLDLIRWFGIPVAILILIAVLYPAFELAREKDAVSYLAIPYAAYLWEAATNPLLVCSFGALLVSAIWGSVLMRRLSR